MTGPGEGLPWMSAWLAAEREFARVTAGGSKTTGSATAEAQQMLADYAADYAAIAGAFWNQLQSPRPDFEAMREPLIERYRRLFMPPGAAAAGAGPAAAGAAWIRCQQASERYARQATAIAIDACERFRVALAASGPDAPPITSLRELHALWIDCGEAAYSDAAQRGEFASAQADLLSALVELRA
ncbi:MAG: poly(R)-hydroxyalkanoic acid synthase subunit PhaE, partial [Pseudonocardiaceae bacterium]